MFLLILFCFLVISCSLAKDCKSLIPRDKWGSIGPRGGDKITKPIEIIIFHHTVTPPCFDENNCKNQVKSIQNYHKTSAGFDDIGYNFVIGGDGSVYEGRGWENVGAHTRGQNSKSYGVAFIGDYSSVDPPEDMLVAARDLIICGIFKGHITMNYGLYGGRDFSCTESPGRHFYETLKSFVKWHAKGEFNKSC